MTKRKAETKTRKWSKEAMEQAMQEVQGGRLTSRQAAKKFGVPKSSLSDRLTGKVSVDPVQGRKQLLIPEDENSLVEYCLYSASQGNPLTKTQVVAQALAIYNYRNPDTPKTLLGQTWWRNFKDRHQHCLATQTIDFADQVKESSLKSGLTEDFFRLLTAILEEKGLSRSPCQIYNCAKTGFQLYSGRKKVPNETKRSCSQSQRDHISVLACFNAAGDDVPPFIIYKREYPEGHYKKEGLPNTLYGTSYTGDLDGDLFRKWFFEHFLKFAVQERPLLVILDESQSQVDPELVQEAQAEKVILLFLPPHCSHVLQPLEVSFFGPLKADFTEDLSADSQAFSVSRKEFSKILRNSYQELKDQQVVVDGFRRCGIYPPNSVATDSSQFKLSKMQQDKPATAKPTALASCATSDTMHRTCLLSPVDLPSSPSATLPSSLYLTHPLVSSGRIPADLAYLMVKTNQTCYRGRVVRRNAQVLAAQTASHAVKKEITNPAMGVQTPPRVQHQGTDDISSDESCVSHKRGLPCGNTRASTSDLSSAVLAPTSPCSTSHSPSVTEGKPLFTFCPGIIQFSQLAGAFIQSSLHVYTQSLVSCTRTLTFIILFFYCR